MVSEKYAVQKFDALVKKSLSNELKYRIRSLKNRSKRIVIFSDMSNSEMNQLYYEDTYDFNNFRRCIETKIFDAIIHDELLYEALQLLNPKVREIIVLKYWGKYSDQEVGRLLNMSRRMVCYNKNKAIVFLREIIEELRKNDERFKL